MRLRCLSGPLTGEIMELEPGQSYILGREPKPFGVEKSILLASKTVSRNHCILEWKEGRLQIRDLQSSNGIRVNRKKVPQTELQERDLIQVGEFSFVVEEGERSTTGIQADEAAAATPPGVKWNLKIPVPLQRAFEKFEKLDFKIRSLVLILFSGILIQMIITVPFLSDARRSLLKESFEVGRGVVQSLGERNKRELGSGSHFLLDCTSALKPTSGILEMYLLDARGRSVCPIGLDLPRDELTETAVFRGEPADDCSERVIYGGYETCDFVYPIREWKDDQAQYVTVGVSRLRYEPVSAQDSLQKLRTTALKSFIFSVLVLLGLWWLLQLWIQRAMGTASEAVHLAVSGAAQNVDTIESFAAFEPLIDEVNRLISKSIQSLSENSSDQSSEASFLQLLLQQVLLLEERAVMVVDKDNQLIAASTTLPAMIPIDVDQMNAHITQVVHDTHLQGELMGLLNDLSSSNEVIDRPLSMADRVVHVRGMPLFMRDDYIASVLIF